MVLVGQLLLASGAEPSGQVVVCCCCDGGGGSSAPANSGGMGIVGVTAFGAPSGFS